MKKYSWVIEIILSYIIFWLGGLTNSVIGDLLGILGGITFLVGIYHGYKSLKGT